MFRDAGREAAGPVPRGGDRPVAGGVPCGSARGGARDAHGRPLRAAARGLYGDADRDAARSRDLRRTAARRRGLWRSGSATKASHVSERDRFSQAVFSLRPRLSRHERPLVRRASYLLPVRIHPCRPDCIARPPDSRVGGRTIQAYQSMYPAGPPGLDRSEPRGQTWLHFRRVTVAGSSSSVCVRTCGPGSPHAGHLPPYISSALTPASRNTLASHNARSFSDVPGATAICQSCGLCVRPFPCDTQQHARPGRAPAGAHRVPRPSSTGVDTYPRWRGSRSSRPRSISRTLPS
jgi:hypothetical protein